MENEAKNMAGNIPSDQLHGVQPCRVQVELQVMCGPEEDLEDIELTVTAALEHLAAEHPEIVPQWMEIATEDVVRRVRRLSGAEVREMLAAGALT